VEFKIWAVGLGGNRWEVLVVTEAETGGSGAGCACRQDLERSLLRRRRPGRTAR
jgi:hypothetical protein